MNEIVDVLIIGSGASGAAVAWGLADARMNILCLEQGDWMKQSDYPSNKRDWEARVYGDFTVSPNVRARPTNYPERSVVNEWGRCHDVKNLFIVDGSIFVTSGGVNPTSTIQALALCIADSIKQRLATLFD
jgi:choline dehydrogenase-like flavoprotein